LVVIETSELVALTRTLFFAIRRGDLAKWSQAQFREPSRTGAGVVGLKPEVIKG